MFGEPISSSIVKCVLGANGFYAPTQLKSGRLLEFETGQPLGLHASWPHCLTIYWFGMQLTSLTPEQCLRNTVSLAMT